MPDTPQSLAIRLREEGDRVIDFFNHLTERQWDIIVYPQTDEWTMHHLLAHFVSAEIGRQVLITDIVNGGRGVAVGFDIDSFNNQEVNKLLAWTNKYLLELFLNERYNLIMLVSELKQSDLERMGNDPFLGQTSLLEIIKLTYRHLQIHLRDARRYI